MLKFVIAHPVLIASIVTWLATNVGTIMVGSLPAPTAQSTPKYVYWFKVLNALVGMAQRSKSTAIEQSPNFLPAVERYLQDQENKKQRIATGVGA